MNGRDEGLPLEHFIQAVTSQLDRAQETMALKAKAGLRLTFAVKDLTLDLRTHVEMAGAEVRIRPAGPGEGDTSVLHLALTTITRPMIEENTVATALDPDEPTLEDVLPETSEDDRRRLEWAGIRTVSQLRDVQRSGGMEAIRRVSTLPVDRLRAALTRASQPQVSAVLPVHPGAHGDASGGAEGYGPAEPPLLRIRGRNLVGERPPRVRIDGQSTHVIDANERELVVRPRAGLIGGLLEVETAPGEVASTTFSFENENEEEEER